MRHVRRVNEQLKQNEAALRAVADNASDLVRIIDEDARLVYVSPSCERILGYSREEMLAMPARALLPEEERENAVKMTIGAQAGLAETGRFVHRLLTKAGDLRWFETYYCLVREGAKKTARIHLTSRDITERRQHEAAIQGAGRPAAQPVAARRADRALQPARLPRARAAVTARPRRAPGSPPASSTSISTA